MNRCTKGAVRLIFDRLEKRMGTYEFASVLECLGGRTPYSMALETLGKEALNAFQLRPIAPDEVNLTPKLIRFNH